MTNLLELQNLKKYFATQKAVDDMSFSIQKGSIFGLLGYFILTAGRYYSMEKNLIH